MLFRTAPKVIHFYQAFIERILMGQMIHSKSQILLTLFTILMLIIICETFNRCGQKKKNSLQFYLVQPCISSKMNVLASSNVNSIESCQKLAIQNKGLAFSYLSERIASEIYESDYYDDDDGDKTSCKVFDCPEFESTLTLQQISTHHYYSLYARPMANKNVTCIPGIGIFILHKEKKNQSEAVQICKDEGGVLASPCSERRTMHLSHVIASVGQMNSFDKWYVGLDDIEMEGNFVSSTGELLKCSQFRAWAPGEPHSRKEDNCVVINPRFTWQVVPCSKKLPFICEVLPGGPLQICSGNSSSTRKKECIEDHLNRTEYLEYNSKCKLPDGYLKNLTGMLEEIESSVPKINSTT